MSIPLLVDRGSGAASASAAAGVRERAFVPTLVAIGLVVSVISSLGAPLIPTLATELHASIAATQWSLTATLLVGAVASPLVGRLGDGRQRKPVLVTCLALVTAGGALAALSTSLAPLVAGRALQGLGLALMPLTMAAAREHLPAERGARVIATLSVVAAVGVGLGYPITGLVAERLGTSAAFWFGCGASAVALLLAVAFVPNAKPVARPGRLDVRGAALVGGGILALLIGLEKAPEWGWVSAATLAPLALSVVLVGAFALNESRVAAPLVELHLLRRRSVLSANVTGFVLGVAMYLGISSITQFVQLPEGLGESTFVAGLTLLPLSASSMLSSRALPAVARRTGQRATIPLGCLVIAAALVFLWATGDELWQVLVTMGGVGLGLGFTFAAMPGLIVGSVPRGETSSAMSFYQVSRYVGFSVGSGLAVTLLRAFGGGAAVPPLDAYGWTFLCGAVLCVAAAIVAWVAPGEASATRDSDELAVEEGELGAAGLQRLEEA